MSGQTDGAMGVRMEHVEDRLKIHEAWLVKLQNRLPNWAVAVITALTAIAAAGAGSRFF